MDKKHPNFNALQSAFKARRQVKFFYIAESDGKARYRVGFVIELTATHVTILDVLVDGARKCVLDKIRGAVTPLRE
jgi:predicted DNA-binding transcriptional regulator YafY